MNNALRGIYGPTKEGVIKELRKSHKEEVPKLK
jgi:hypothetical protein